MNNTEKALWNRILLMLVFILLGLAIFILFKIAFFPFGFDIKDWGTRSDLLSSISTAIGAVGTLGTLIVALMAYRKAPDWITQKNYDIVSKIIEDAIYDDLRKLSSLSIQYKRNMMNTCIIFKNCLNNKNDVPSNIKESLGAIEGLLIELFNLSYSIQNRLKSVSRYSYINTNYTLDIINKIKHIADSYNDLQTRFELSASEVPMLMKADEQAIIITIKELVDVQNETIKLNMNLADFIRYIYTENRPISEFIIKK